MDFSTVLKFLCVLACGILITSTHGNSGEQNCATLYTAEDFTGDWFEVSHGINFNHFGDDIVSNETWWNVTKSFRVQHGCTLTACSETYFDGNCRDFREEASNLPEEFQNILSLSCSCPQKCKCEDANEIRMRSCARAYINTGGCNSCQSYYLNLKQGESELFPTKYEGNVTAIIVNRGCNLTTFDGVKLQGNIHFSEGIVEDWKAPVRSFKCECSEISDSQYTPVPLERPSNYPGMIDIPNSLEKIQEMMAGDNERHPGLMAALQSNGRKRSTKNAYILLLGTTGAGKSSAINMLFDNPEVTQEGGSNTTTKDIVEYRIPVPVHELGIRNSELRVIDTPGLGNTEGIGQDARFLATLDDYLSSHEELKNRIPNVVLIFYKFTDNRFAGESSSFVRTIRGLDSFKNRITDKKYSNVIFVFSHFLSETKKITRNPKRKLSSFKTVIDEFSRLPRPILMAVSENKPADAELLKINGYFKLPNGDYYPKNLFDRITEVTRGGGDAIGEAVIRSAFKNPDLFNVTSRVFPIKDSTRSIYYLGVLTASIFQLENTQLSEKLAEAEESMGEDLKQQFPDALHYTQKTLNLMGFKTEADLPRTTTGIVKLFTELRQNPGVFYLLKKAFDLSPPLFPQNIIAGYSYNVFKDLPLSVSPFDMGETQISEIGYQFPSVVSCVVDSETRDIFKFYKNREEYLKERLESLNIGGTVSLQNFTGAIKQGNNILDEMINSTGNIIVPITAIREFRTFKLVLNNKYTLTDAFKQSVLRLEPFNNTNIHSVESWKSFFSKYGTHIVKSVYGGGAIDIELHTNKPFSSKIPEALMSLIQFAEDISVGKTGNSSIHQQEILHSLRFLGGDKYHHITDLTKMPLEKAADLFENWKNSLSFSPTILKNEMTLIPLSEITKRLGQNISLEIEKATAILFNSSLTYKQKTTSNSVLYPTDRTALENTQIDLCGKFMERMMQESRKAEERYEMLMISMKGNQAKAEEEMRMAYVQQRESIQEQRRKEDERRHLKEAIKELLPEIQLQRKREDEELQKTVEAERLANQLSYKQELWNLQKRSSDIQGTSMMRMLKSDHAGLPGKGCLREGTLILMADLTQKPVELLEVGDFVMDHELQPVKVNGVLGKFLMNDSFHGFNNESFFFTDTHQIVGSRNGLKGPLQIYAKDLEATVSENPLLSYLNLKQLPETSHILKYRAEKYEVTPEKVLLYSDPTTYPQDTVVHIILVDSEIGTYIANGFACRHEMHPLQFWPNTLRVLFALATEPRIQWISEVPYTIENIQKLNNVVNGAFDKLQVILNGISSNSKNDEALEELPLAGDVNSVIYGNPTMFTFASGIYAKLGPALAAKVEVDNCVLSDLEVRRIQSIVFEQLKEYFVQAFSKYFDIPLK